MDRFDCTSLTNVLDNSDGMWGVWDVGCLEYWMLRMCDVRYMGCSGCWLFCIWDVRDVEYLGCFRCEMFRMWDVRGMGCLGCGMWDGCQNLGC